MTTQTTNNTVRELADFLKTLDRVAVTTHVGADGDAIGSSAALVRLMRALGAEAVFCHAEAVPGYLGWLLPDDALTELPTGHDLLVVDTSRPDRTGVPTPDEGARLNLDHHEDNPLYAEYNLVNAGAAATAQLVAELYRELEIPLDRAAAEAIYVGVRTDTGGFTFRNISPEAHELVADLLRAGVVPAEVNERINRRGSIEQLKIVGVVLANAVQYGDVLISTVDKADYERTGAGELDSKEAIDQLRTVAGVDVVAHLREVPEGTKGSLRSESVDVGAVARIFGGGGHKLAAGYTRKGMKPREAKEELLENLEGDVDLGGGR
ncbi:MAG: bifunctional oligoribonuclease/PAP phosphatase NrnA [Actinomycetota bacterium]|jgi:phosphoesterase RecJ-like protein|nr:bifunctional oligoribonuclease/PAP phosphatase NrnA [Actinomycetota bacterium]